MNESIVTAIISGGTALIVCVVNSFFQSKAVKEQHDKTISLIEYKIVELTKKVEKHNSVVDRMFEVEKSTELLDEKMNVANHRISDLEDSEKRR